MKVLKTILWALVIVAGMGIFGLSSQPATQSAGLSKGISMVILESAEKLKIVESDLYKNEDKLDNFDDQLRQFAHSFIYFIFAFLLISALRHSGMRLMPALVLTLLISCAFAGLDEWHQSYVPGRGAEFIDFASDAAGMLLAAILGAFGQILGRAMKINQV